MRTLIDLADAQIRALDDLAKRRKQSRAALIRSAVDDYLTCQGAYAGADAFGLWGRGFDGVVYQDRVRGEW